MQKALLIAEKPSERRTIEAVYMKHRNEIGVDISFLEQRGHLLTLKMPDELDESLKQWRWETLPIHPEEHGGWQYKVIQEKKVGNFLTSRERYQKIADELKSGGYDFVINAGDPDQEGELLVRIVLGALRNKLPVKRYWSNDTTEEKVLEALKNLGDDDRDPAYVNLLSAAYARQRSDYRYGINVSRAATLKMGARVACGRVKTPIMSLVCRREKEILSFRPETVYGVKADYVEGFSCMYYSPDGEGEDAEPDENGASQKGIVYFKTREEAESLIARLDSSAVVVSYSKKRSETYAPKLFKLATAQISAGKLGYNSAKTLEIIQSLYDKGYLSYPRTDCEYISSHEDLYKMLKSASSVPGLAEFVKAVPSAAVNKVKATKKWVDDEKLKASGHSALVPTSLAPDFNSLTKEQQDIYGMVCRQFVAIFLPPLVQDKTEIITDNGSGCLFKGTGSTVVDRGYSVIFGTDFSDNPVPGHNKGDAVKVSGYGVAEKTSKCPKRYTDATLIAACEDPAKYLDDKRLKALGKRLKIGTPATRAGIIEELISRDHYLKRTKEKKTEYIVPADLGMQIYDNLKDLEICKVDLTGRWEEMLEDIRTGKLSLPDMERQIKSDVEALIKEIYDARDMGEVKRDNARKKIAVCPECGGDVMSGPKGFYCSNYKSGCKFGAFKKVCDSTVADDEFIKLISGETIVKKIKKGDSSWDQKLGYSLEEHKICFVQGDTAEKESSYKCPHCHKNVTEERWKYSCSCGFAFWKSPYKGQKSFTDEQVASFFAHGTTGVVKGLTGKSGKRFSAEFVLSEDRLKSEMKFIDRKHK